MQLPFAPTLAPMLAKPVDGLPHGDGWLYEPKWDGFRTLVYRDGPDIYLQSRDEKPMNRYFPDLVAGLPPHLPERCILDGEAVIAGPNGLDFDSLLLRIHPAASRVAMLAKERPAAFVAFDLLALGDDDLRAVPQEERRRRLEDAVGPGAGPLYLTPATRDRAVAADWFDRFEGAGLDGVIAKRLADGYHAGERTMLKIKHERTADCVVAGFRWHKNGPGTLVGSLLLGLYDGDGILHHVGVTSGFTMTKRRELVEMLEPLRADAKPGHPWQWGHEDEVVAGVDEEGQRRPGMTSRWNRGKNLSWEPLRIERVVEVAYDHMQGTRFRHAAGFRRWRPDRQPADCRYDQLEVTPPFELEKIFVRSSC